jgi:hypothetical protein
VTTDREAFASIRRNAAAEQFARWEASIVARIERFMLERDRPFEFRSSDKSRLRSVVCLLDDRGIPFRQIYLAAGVHKITTACDTCPKCHGTGRR